MKILTLFLFFLSTASIMSKEPELSQKVIEELEKQNISVGDSPLVITLNVANNHNAQTHTAVTQEKEQKKEAPEVKVIVCVIEKKEDHYWYHPLSYFAQLIMSHLPPIIK